MGADYSLHAKYWDWDDFDNSQAYQFWFNMSKKYGPYILSAMCAIGQTAAYMANSGATVIALDYTKEMIDEGKKRFGYINNLNYVQADICNFSLDQTFDFCFMSSADIHLLSSFFNVRKALININRHLRLGGGLGLEVWFAPPSSFSSPLTRFDPRVPRRKGVYIWKESESSYNAETKIQSIHQVVHVDNQDIQFEHDVNLQLYDRSSLLNLLAECGFDIINTYCNIDSETSDNENDNCFLELVKSKEIE